MTGLEHSTSLSRAYRERRDAMEEAFPAAVSFLRGLEVLCDGDHGFHMGTALNVQFYLGDAFLFYLQLVGPRSERPALMLSPHHHGQLREGTRDASNVVFRHRIRAVIDTLSLPSSAVIRRKRGYLISPETPPAFFDLLLAGLLDVVRLGDARPLQRDLFALAEEEAPRRGRGRRSRRTARVGRRPTGEQRVVSLAREVDDALGLLAAELQDRLGQGVTLDVRAGRARLSGEVGGSAWSLEEETVALLVDRALSAPVVAAGAAKGPGGEAVADGGDPAAQEAPAGEALEELGSLVVEGRGAPDPGQGSAPEPAPGER